MNPGVDPDCIICIIWCTILKNKMVVFVSPWKKKKFFFQFSFINADPLFAGNLFNFFSHVSLWLENIRQGFMWKSAIKWNLSQSFFREYLGEGKDFEDEGVTRKTDLGFSLRNRFPPVPYSYTRNLLKFSRLFLICILYCIILSL